MPDTSARPTPAGVGTYAPPDAVAPAAVPPPAPLSDAESAALATLAVRVWRWRGTRPLLLAFSAYVAGAEGRVDLLPAIFGAPTATVSAEERTTLHRTDSQHADALAQLRLFADSSRADRALLHRHMDRMEREQVIQRRGVEQTREIAGVIGCTVLPAATRLALRLPCARLNAGEPWPLDSAAAAPGAP